MSSIDVIDNYFDHYKLIKYEDSNLEEPIKLYHKWYDAALELFTHYFQAGDRFYDKFSSVDNSGNGFVLHQNFNAVRGAYIVLSNLIKNKEPKSTQQIIEKVFATGSVWDAWAYMSDLVRSAKQRIILIDNYVDDRVLSLLLKRSDNVSATIHTRYNKQLLTDLTKHNEQYHAIELIQLPQKSHDRFLIVDDKIFLLGTSLKDIGTGLCAIIEMHIKPEIILDLLKNQRDGSSKNQE
jgi:hypothetical protein